MIKKAITLTIFTLLTAPLFAQFDSLIFNNGNYLTGTVESMDKGIIAIETDYSDSDFMIEWEKIDEIYTTSSFIVALSDGREFLSKINTTTPGKLMIHPDGGEAFEVNAGDVVYLNPISSAFLDRLSANIDVGLSITKAQSIRQLSVRSAMAYEAPKWMTDISFNSTQSDQDEVEATKRTDAAINFRVKLPRKLYAIATVSVLSNTEQLLDLRANSQAGVGAYLFRSNAAYWGAKLGLNRNFERYTDPVNDGESWEGFMGTELNLYDIGDLSFKTDITVYPSITQKGRWRSDLGMDVKYEFPMDFYISAGFSLNWDNQPAEGADPIDYVFMTGFGWEW